MIVTIAKNKSLSNVLLLDEIIVSSKSNKLYRPDKYNFPRCFKIRTHDISIRRN